MNLLTLQHQRAQTESYLRDFKKDLRKAKIPAAGDTEQLRRQCPVQLHSGMTVLLYSEGKLLGEATCDRWDLSRSADDIARRYWQGSALCYEAAQAYLEDARRPGALHLTSPSRYTKPQAWQGAPVQNFLYL